MGGSRAAAVRAAHSVVAERIEALKAREVELGDVLADYFEAKAGGEEIRAHATDRAERLAQSAKQKAEKLLQEAHVAGEELVVEAEKDASRFDAQVGDAVRRLLELGESRAGVAEITGLSPRVVRAIEREHLPPEPDTPRKRRQSSHSTSRTRSTSPA